MRRSASSATRHRAVSTGASRPSPPATTRWRRRWTPSPSTGPPSRPVRSRQSATASSTGSLFAAPTLVDDAVVAAVTELVPLAPLHNPANLDGLRVARRLFPGVPQVAVFDTAFHQTMPVEAYTYAIPRAWREEHQVRRYGFHGTSHAFVSRAAADLLGRRPEETNLITLHLGNGASATAVRAGRSIDTSMGLTPLEGLVMGTRSGDVDPAVHAHLHRTLGYSLEDIDHALNHESGLRGLSGHNDFREVMTRRAGRGRGRRSNLRRLRPPDPKVRRCLLRRPRRRAWHRLHRWGRPAQRRAAVGALSGLHRLGIVLDPARNSQPLRAPTVVSGAGRRGAGHGHPDQRGVGDRPAGARRGPGWSAAGWAQRDVVPAIRARRHVMPARGCSAAQNVA